MSFAPMPVTAAWHHRGARSGFEVTYFSLRDGGCHIEGWTTAIEDGTTWAVEYSIDVDAAWATHRARIRGRSAAGVRLVQLETDGAGHWRVDGEPAPRLDGCLDVDLEASAMTNALPIRRMDLPVTATAAAPAAYVRAVGLDVDRLEQTYARITDEADCQRYDYTAPAFGYSGRLIYDQAGLVLDYPQIAVRAGLAALIDTMAWVHVENGRILCARPRGKDVFYIPGGKREGTENDLQVLLREITEELTVTLRPETVRHAGTYEAAQPDGRPAGTVVRMSCYRGDYSGTLAPSTEIAELAWFCYADRGRVPPVDQLLFDDLRAAGELD